jgi:CDP-diglyceride synthetase
MFPFLYFFSMNPLVVYIVTILNLIIPLLTSGPNIGIKAGLFNIFFLYMFAIPTLFGSLIRNLEIHGRTITTIWLLSSFASDAGALIVGSALGRHLCCPSISPKKTWEGVIGAHLGGIGSGIIFYFIGLDQSGSISLADFCIFGALASLFGMTGDLIESGFKRFVSAKDSSGWLPGHGGYLDRLDALGACAPVFYFYGRFRGW